MIFPFQADSLIHSLTHFQDQMDEKDARRNLPRFDAIANNVPKEDFKAIAARKGCTPAQLALAWLHAQV